jgi:hypothetical protein
MKDIAQHLKEQLKIEIPPFYIDFLKEKNLKESRLLDNDLTLLYGADELTEMNQAYEIQQYLPEYLNIGNDSGDYALLIKDAEVNDTCIYLVEYGSLDRDDICTIAFSMEQWKLAGYTSQIEDAVDLSPFTKRRNAAYLAYQQTIDYQLDNTHQDLLLQLRKLENSKQLGELNLKDYLKKKQEMQLLLKTFLSKYEGTYKTFNVL